MIKELFLSGMIFLGCSNPFEPYTHIGDALNNFSNMPFPTKELGGDSQIKDNARLEVVLGDYKPNDFFNFQARITNISFDTIIVDNITKKSINAKLMQKKGNNNFSYFEKLIDYDAGNIFAKIYPQGMIQVETKEDTLIKRVSGVWVDMNGSKHSVPNIVNISKKEEIKNIRLNEGIYRLDIGITYDDSSKINYSKEFEVK